MVLMVTASNAFADGTSCPALDSIIGNIAGVGYAARNNANNLSRIGTYDLAPRYIETKNTFAVNYSGIGVLMGHARCSLSGTDVVGVVANDNPVEPQDVTALDDVTDNTGSATKCYCHVEYFFGADGMSRELSSKWVYHSTDTSNSNCASKCAGYCAQSLQDGAEDHEKYKNAVLLNTESSCTGAVCGTGYHTTNDSSVPDVIKTASASKYAYINNNNVSGVNPTGTNFADYGLTTKNSFAVDFGSNGILTGMGRCSSRKGFTDDLSKYTWANPTKFYALTDETGVSGARYCYCMLQGYTVADKHYDISGLWVFRNGMDNCSTTCAQNCADRIKSGDNYTAFRTALLSNLQSCAVNHINIVWSDVPEEYKNSVVEYGGNIDTPSTYIQRADGARFLGWAFSATPPETGND